MRKALAAIALLGITAACSRNTDTETVTISPRDTTVITTPTGGEVVTQTGTRMIAEGTRVEATVRDTISSRSNDVGDLVDARLENEVRDAQGNVLFPAGSRVELRITQLSPAGDDEGDTGKIGLEVATVEADGRTYQVASQVDSLSYQLRGREGIDAEKAGIGAAAGAILGGTISGEVRGAVIGGVLGGAAGAVLGRERASRDVVVLPGTTVSFELNQPVAVYTTAGR